MTLMPFYAIVWPCAVANRLWIKGRLDPKEEKLRFSN
jgi:hypothetical protein